MQINYLLLLYAVRHKNLTFSHIRGGGGSIKENTIYAKKVTTILIKCFKSRKQAQEGVPTFSVVIIRESDNASRKPEDVSGLHSCIAVYFIYFSSVVVYACTLSALSSSVTVPTLCDLLCADFRRLKSLSCSLTNACFIFFHFS
ncbi:MAG: hypothetical protein OXC30_02290 [Alphaproteobacteria bacterium]|nr:hypothetical protein [Alphaproteobacteria bacterium]